MERHDLETVSYEKDGPVARIILNRPEKANAQNSAMVWDVENSLKDAEADYAIKVVLMKAAGAQQIAQAPLSVLMAIKAGVKRAWEAMGMRVHLQSQFPVMWQVGAAGDVASWQQENIANGYGPYPRQVAAQRAEVAAQLAAAHQRTEKDGNE